MSRFVAGLFVFRLLRRDCERLDPLAHDLFTGDMGIDATSHTTRQKRAAFYIRFALQCC